MTTLSHIRAALADHEPFVEAMEARMRASVALVLVAEEPEPRLLFIRRSEREGDRWSGHIAFPGGRVDAGDAGPRAAAERETLEEVGLDVAAGEYLGRLDDLTGEKDGIVVSAFVYGLRRTPELVSNHEVDEAFWLDIAQLEEPERHIQRSFDYKGLELDVPALRVLDDGHPVLWGITYGFLAGFMERIGRSIPTMSWDRRL
ncbi:MAG: CoA pyrophosphatase [Deltaproteobacteria bacterium]|nr:CoA pyrophosphatase [Deltaproteobacteria bacterium]